MGLLTNLVSYWKLDDASGDAIDAHGTNDGTVTSATQGVSGKLSDCYEFDGSTSKIDFGTDSNLAGSGGDTITIVAWVWADNYGSYPTIYGKWADVANQRDVILALYSNTGKVAFYSETGSWHYGNTAIGTGAWKHVAVVVDGGSGTFYLNGSSDGTFSGNSWTGGSSPSAWLAKIPANDWWDGKIDEVGVWSRALSGAEISSLYNSGNGFAYPFGEGGGTNMQVNIGDAWKEISAMQINIGDAWKAVAGAQINIGDAWKTIY